MSRQVQALQEVPVLSPAVVRFQPTRNSPVCMLSHIHVGLDSPSRYFQMTAGVTVTVDTTIAVHAGLRVQICIPIKCSILDVVTHLCRYRHNPVGKLLWLAHLNFQYDCTVCAIFNFAKQAKVWVKHSNV